MLTLNVGLSSLYNCINIIARPIYRSAVVFGLIDKSSNPKGSDEQDISHNEKLYKNKKWGRRITMTIYYTAL